MFIYMLCVFVLFFSFLLDILIFRFCVYARRMCSFPHFILLFRQQLKLLMMSLCAPFFGFIVYQSIFSAYHIKYIARTRWLYKFLLPRNFAFSTQMINSHIRFGFCVIVHIALLLTRKLIEKIVGKSNEIME